MSYIFYFVFNDIGYIFYCSTILYDNNHRHVETFLCFYSHTINFLFNQLKSFKENCEFFINKKLYFVAYHLEVGIIIVNIIIFFFFFYHVEMFNYFCIIDPFFLPWEQVDKGAIRFVLSGANIMCPGLTSPGAKMTPVPQGTVVVSFSKYLYICNYGW